MMANKVIAENSIITPFINNAVTALQNRYRITGYIEVGSSAKKGGCSSLDVYFQLTRKSLFSWGGGPNFPENIVVFNGSFLEKFYPYLDEEPKHHGLSAAYFYLVTYDVLRMYQVLDKMSPIETMIAFGLKRPTRIQPFGENIFLQSPRSSIKFYQKLRGFSLNHLPQHNTDSLKALSLDIPKYNLDYKPIPWFYYVPTQIRAVANNHDMLGSAF